MPLFEVLSSLKGSTFFNNAYQPAGDASASGAVKPNCERCRSQSLSPISAPPTDVVSNIRWYDKNRGLTDEQVKGKMKAMSKSPVRFHRMSHFLENGHILNRSDDPCLELFRGRSPPATWIQGDAHLGNFGVVTTGSGQPAYSVNDYDHTGYGTVDMDLKRLATSTVLWGRERGATEAEQRAAVEAAAQSYFDTIVNVANGWDYNFDPSNLHLPPNMIQPNGYIASMLSGANKQSQTQFVESKIKTNPVNGEITIKKTEPVDAATRAQLCEVLGEWSAQLAPERQNFSILSVGKGKDSGGSSAGLDRFRVLIQDAAGSRHLVEIKNAPPSSVEDQTGLNRFDADRMIKVQTQMGEFDSYAGSIEMNGKSFFTRELHPHKTIEKNISTMQPAHIQEAARAAGSILARAHSATIKDPEALIDWVGDCRIEQAEAAKRLYNYAADYATTTANFQQLLKKAVDGDKKKK